MAEENKLPDEVIDLMAQFIRDMTKHNCAIVGLVYCTEPRIGLGTMRNDKGDTLALFQKATKIVELATQQGSTYEVPVLPLQ